MRQAFVVSALLAAASMFGSAGECDPLADKYRQLYGHEMPKGRGPFAEMDAFQAAFDRAYPAKNPFLAPDRGWALDPSLEPGVSARIVDDAPRVALEVRIPGLGARPVDVSVAGETIRLAYRKETPSPREGGIALDAVQRVEQLFPLPAGADPRTARVEREGDRVRVVFETR